MAELQQLIAQQREQSFTDPASVTDAEALGILIAQHFNWDGIRILETAVEALTEANFHGEASAVEEMLELTHR